MSSTELKEKVPKRKFETTDYHDWVGPDSTKEKCQAINIGEYYINAVECKQCGWYIRSKNLHDYVTCKCGSCSVDGGSHYLKRVGFFDQMIERSVLFDWAKQQIN